MSLSDPIGDMIARIKNASLEVIKKYKCHLLNLKQK